MEASTRNFLVELFLFSLVVLCQVKLRALEECSICQMTECLAIVITQKMQMKSELLLLFTGQKQ